jgi:tetratricopeptide (TPR) repeat protein
MARMIATCPYGSFAPLAMTGLTALSLGLAPAQALAQSTPSTGTPSTGTPSTGTPSTGTSSETRTAGRDAEARQLFDAGTVAYSEGRYENALEYMQRAYELSGRPALLYNVATTLERLRRDDEALAAYERYLAEEPAADNRQDVEARIAILRRVVSERGDSGGGAGSDSGGAGSDSGGSIDAGPWVLVGAGGAAAIAGGILLGLAAADVASVEGAPAGSYWSRVSDAYGRSEAESIAGAVLLGVGGAAAAAGVVWALVPSGGGSSGGGERAAVTLAPTPGGLTLRGSF